MSKQSKPRVWWCVKHPDGDLIPPWSNFQRCEVIRMVEREADWADLKKEGYSVVKIEVREVT